MKRLGPKPGEILDRSRRLSFRFDGKSCEAYPGDTVASALLASGVKIFSRSFKYHRPRGLLCVSGNCPNCLMNVNGTPNVRTCTRPVQEGDQVTSQHCWPSPRWDLLSLIERLDALMPVGFYYKTLIRPRLMWRLAEPVIRRLAGLGSLKHSTGEPAHYEHEHRHTEIVVAGGGATGMAAALAAAEAGAQVVLVESETKLGGRLRSQSVPVVGSGHRHLPSRLRVGSRLGPKGPGPSRHPGPDRVTGLRRLRRTAPEHRPEKPSHPSPVRPVGGRDGQQ